MYTNNNKGGAHFCPTFIPCVASHSAGWFAVPGLTLALCKHGKLTACKVGFMSRGYYAAHPYQYLFLTVLGSHCKRVFVYLLMMLMITPKCSLKCAACTCSVLHPGWLACT